MDKKENEKYLNSIVLPNADQITMYGRVTHVC